MEIGFGQMRAARFFAVLAAVVVCSLYTNISLAQVNLGQLRTWGLETYGQIDSTLRVQPTQLFAETASLSGAKSGGFNGRAFVWPAATQFRVFDALAKIQPTTYTPILRQFSDQLLGAYYNNGYRSGAGGGDR